MREQNAEGSDERLQHGEAVLRRIPAQLDRDEENRVADGSSNFPHE
jgi:hypothetical protein